MTEYRKAIDVYCYYFQSKEYPTPTKWRMVTEDGEEKVFEIKKILSVNKEKLLYGNSYAYVYTCQSIVDGNPFTYELSFSTDRFKWLLVRVL